MKILGLYGVKNTYVGDGVIRGISGGQKRRVTMGEMFLFIYSFIYFINLTLGPYRSRVLICYYI